MNKILKIIIKSDPIFKYIVEDYPFYEGIFFHSKDFNKMAILNFHYILRINLAIDKGNTELFCKSKYLMHLIFSITSPPPKLSINPKSKVKTKANLYLFNILKTNIKLNLRLKIQDKNYSKSTINLHMIKLIRLKTHDPYTIENRDMLKLSNMDGEKIL